jgi:hypothetical protein
MISVNGRVIRPTPFISVSSQPIRTGSGNSWLGTDYTITLTGTILDSEGSPFSDGSFAINYARPFRENIGTGDASHAILTKQNALRALFSIEGMYIEVLNADADFTPALSFYATLESINFEEGSYVNTCGYTVTLKTTSVKNHAQLTTSESNDYEGDRERVQDFQESWSIEVDESASETIQGVDEDGNFIEYFIPRGYSIVRNISATGRTTYTDGSKIDAWRNAKDYLYDKGYFISGPQAYPDNNIAGLYGAGTLNLIGYLGGYNHVRTENIDKTGGTVSYTDTWTILRDIAYESYSFSISYDNQNAFAQISIEGTIRGVDSSTAYSTRHGGNIPSSVPSKIDNALTKFNRISNSQVWTVTNPLYLRANRAVPLNLNPQPQSVSIGRNDILGEITYNVQFNNRPQNIVSSALSESISVNDTYPGDLYTLIPVIGRPTGPILQYIGGRTEYRRSVNIELIFPFYNVNYGTNRSALVLSKPTLYDPPKTEINNLIKELSPLNEPGIRKCFLDPPQESWNPREGRYSISLNWVYELEY